MARIGLFIRARTHTDEEVQYVSCSSAAAVDGKEKNENLPRIRALTLLVYCTRRLTAVVRWCLRTYARRDVDGQATGERT